jgi:diadenosine tetraphosphatase ApaH/serine/threonine PP2A family protein phosphatase
MDDARDALEAASAPLIFLGHTHVPVAFFGPDPVTYSTSSNIPIEDGSTTIINTGSVGQPRDSNPNACYALYDTERSRVVLRRLAYDIEKTAAKIVEAGLPQVLGKRLSLGK